MSNLRETIIRLGKAKPTENENEILFCEVDSTHLASPATTDAAIAARVGWEEVATAAEVRAVYTEFYELMYNKYGNTVRAEEAAVAQVMCDLVYPSVNGGRRAGDFCKDPYEDDEREEHSPAGREERETEQSESADESAQPDSADEDADSSAAWRFRNRFLRY